MNARRRLERRWLGIPPARSALIETNTWMEADDGARLATRVLRPADASVRRGTVLVRSERPLDGHGASPIERIARWLAEDGRTVAIQSCRGRGESEGEFRAFADESRDGARALDWIAEQSWCDGALVLFGLGYSAFAAWAALARARTPIAALVTGFGARDPYAWLYPGGVLQLEAALALAARLDGRAGYEPAQLDFERAARHRPLGECDRVALRELAAFRDWIAHPERDAWWQERTPALPDAPARALFVSGWYECAFPAAYADFTALAASAARRGLPSPTPLFGPWAAAALPREQRAWPGGDVAEIARSVLAFVARAVGVASVRPHAGRVFALGAGWREAARWPPARAAECTLYLRSDGHAHSLAGDGVLVAEPGDDGADSFTADPADPVPSLGGAAYSGMAGAVDQRPVEIRGDVLCFTGDPLGTDLELAGRVGLTVYLDPDDCERNATAKLVAVAADGAAHWLAQGAARIAPGAAQLEIELGAAAAYLAAGSRVRVELSSSSLPRFARREGDDAPQRYTVRHGRTHPSALRFQALARDETSPPAHTGGPA
jgi:uncharacterized protein